MKKQHLEYTELRSLESVIEQLQGLVEGLRSGALSIARGESQLSLRPDGVIEITLQAEQTSKQERVELSLEWQRQSLSIGSGAPPPAEQQLEGADLEEEDAETLRQSTAPAEEQLERRRAISALITSTLKTA